jgi:acid phosphatase (class A)
MKTSALALAAGISLLLLGAVGTSSAADHFSPGYLKPSDLPDTSLILPPPPAEGSAAQQSDWDVFNQTRKLQNTARWDQARADNEITVEALAGAFSCALGVHVDVDHTPATFHLLSRIRTDLGMSTSRTKALYQRKRPFIGHDQPTCITPTPDLANNGSYPSGHSAVGWGFGLVLAELAPDHASALISRGKAYGDSRVVCGVHFASDVAEGRMAASAVIPALHANAEFNTDLAKARTELAALKDKPDTAPFPGQCAGQGELARRPW